MKHSPVYLIYVSVFSFHLNWKCFMSPDKHRIFTFSARLFHLNWITMNSETKIKWCFVTLFNLLKCNKITKTCQKHHQRSDSRWIVKLKATQLLTDREIYNGVASEDTCSQLGRRGTEAPEDRRRFIALAIVAVNVTKGQTEGTFVNIS